MPAAGHHLAAVIPQKGGPLAVVERPTPIPGPKELLIEVHAIALNPIDYYQRNLGFMIQDYPAITGSDVAGVVISVGGDVPSDAAKPGTRVTAFASSFFYQGAPNYGSFQKYVLVPAENVAALPDSITFTEGCVFPMGIFTAWNGWRWAGVPRNGLPESDSKQGVLVWGATSSVGTIAVQVAKLMGYKVYATSSPRHHEYLKTLGVLRAFDYASQNVSSDVVNAAKEDGLMIRMGYVGRGSQQLVVDVMNELKGEGNKARVAMAPIVDEDLKLPADVEAKLVTAPEGSEARSEFFHFMFPVWLQEKLAAGQLVPSPNSWFQVPSDWRGSAIYQQSSG